MTTSRRYANADFVVYADCRSPLTGGEVVAGKGQGECVSCTEQFDPRKF